MIFVDSRAGSHELVEPLQGLGLPVEETTLEFGDIAFEGRGPNATPLAIGIEVKKLPDLIGSLRTGRLQGHQLVGMTNVYNYSWLLIEGELLVGKDGRLERRARYGSVRRTPYPGQMTAGELLKRLHVMQVCAGLTPLWASTRQLTLLQIEMLYRVWTDRAFEEHRSYVATYTPPSLVPISRMRHMLEQLPKVGHSASLAAQKAFRSIRRAVNAPEDAWADLRLTDRHNHTKRLGTKAARAIQEALDHEPD